MKKIILSLILSFLSTVSFAETSGKFDASGMGSWEVNVMNAGNGNMAITYDGNAGLADKDTESIFHKSTMNCVGGLTLTAGKFEDETGMCTFYLTDGEKIFINYKGKGTGGVGGSGDFLIIGGTGKYENISGKGFSSRQNLKGKSGFAHSMNQMSGSYTY
jgi:hypothetical protein|tara:strand:+ start:165 stop:644 length:480 start_codon:yes stop_codon:yes gene_type:complete